MEPRICQDVLWNKVEGDVVILNLESGIYFSLSGVGSRFWELIAEGASRKDAVQRLTAEYKVEAPQLESDLEALLRDLSTEGLVSIEGQAIQE
jgi:coenzyme PQQ synthesis protein D (PqqD)